MKPTPGPYSICTVSTPDGKHDGYVVVSDCDNSIVMATFFEEGHEEKSRANAEAWIAGIAALEKLGRIRDVLWNKNNPAGRLDEIELILKE